MSRFQSFALNVCISRFTLLLLTLYFGFAFTTSALQLLEFFIVIKVFGFLALHLGELWIFLVWLFNLLRRHNRVLLFGVFRLLLLIFDRPLIILFLVFFLWLVLRQLITLR